MHVLVATDKFRGTLTAAQAADAVATGWLRTRPYDVVDPLPLADGGEGTVDALVAALGGERRAVRVPGPLGDPVYAMFGLVARPEATLGIVEMAQASGLELVPETRRNALRARRAAPAS